MVYSQISRNVRTTTDMVGSTWSKAAVQTGAAEASATQASVVVVQISSISTCRAQMRYSDSFSGARIHLLTSSMMMTISLEEGSAPWAWVMALTEWEPRNNQMEDARIEILSPVWAWAWVSMTMMTFSEVDLEACKWWAVVEAEVFPHSNRAASVAWAVEWVNPSASQQWSKTAVKRQ